MITRTGFVGYDCAALTVPHESMAAAIAKAYSVTFFTAFSSIRESGKARILPAAGRRRYGAAENLESAANRSAVYGVRCAPGMTLIGRTPRARDRHCSECAFTYE